MIELTPKQLALIHASALRLLEAKTIKDVVAAIGYDPRSFYSAILSHTQYSSFSIPKKKGGFRLIEAPEQDIKKIQQRLNLLLQIVYNQMKPEYVHGFIARTDKSHPSFNIITNAASHVGKKYVLNIDLQNFFHSITVPRVKEVFRSYPFYRENDVAACLAVITTYNGRLPMGAPTSPVISNFACFLLDRKLKQYAIENNLDYSRYADDLTFSSQLEIKSSNIEEIGAIIENYNFRIQPTKVRLKTSSSSQVVTGLKVNEKVNVSREFVRSIRAMLHNLETKGIWAAARQNRNEQHFLNILKGKLNYLRMVRGEEDEIYRRFMKQWNNLTT